MAPLSDADTDVDFDVTISNFGPDSAEVVFLDNPVPSGTTFVSAVQTGAATFTCTDPGVGNLGLVECTSAALAAGWRRRGYDLAVGIGIAQGYATLGAIGFEGRLDYGAIGTVTNLAARLCGEAESGQILISPRIFSKLEMLVDAEVVGELALKGFQRPVLAHNVTGVRQAAEK